MCIRDRENKGHIDDEFRKKWCYSDDYQNVGFDWVDTISVCSYMCRSYNRNTIILKDIVHTESDANKCFLTAISNGLDGLVDVGDIIFPLEPDAFLLETDKEIIAEEISKLKPGDGLSCMWRDFLGTQYYCEAINEQNPKIRRFCYCFDTMEGYKEAMNGFMTQSYPKLKYTDKFWIRHYPWFVSGLWKELRYELIWRKDPQYWQDFERGLNEIENWSTEYVDDQNCEQPDYERGEILEMPDKILVRPSRQDEGRYAKFIDIEHPTAIYNHENFVK